ncbi:BTAD domain-containing putative transcriptional regulator [Streptomyces sp. NPDC052496]|uniref:AfsR/SARP family transcriptional regulator n=1 Tax=Streptomyces sp. NPDC052496 TaxID=3154951 RepID=UPI0034219E74
MGTRIAVLGPVRVFDGDGTPVGIGGARPRMLLARLALAAGDMVAQGALIDGLWGVRPPTDALNSLHALVYRLRKALPDGGLLESSGAGCRLAVPRGHVDAARFEALAARGGQELAAGTPGKAASVLGEALALWQGPALADVREAPYAASAAARPEELRVAAFEDRCEAELRLGHHTRVLADLETAAADHPLREEAVEAVCSGGPLPAGDVPYVLGSLVDKSLVERAGDGYRMLETVRAYAVERLLQAGEREAVRDRLVRHFAGVAEEHEPLLRSARQEESFALFAAEYDNLAFALRTAVDGRDADAAARLLGPLRWYWNALRHDARAGSLAAGVCELGDAQPEDAARRVRPRCLRTGPGGDR